MQARKNMQEVRAALIMRGWHSVAAWAVAHGYMPITVRRYIYDWWHRTDREPLGGIARQIGKDLRAEIGEESDDRGAA